MRKIIVLSMITLDNVLQGPGSPEEDPSGGFEYGGWVAPFDDEVYDKVVKLELKQAEYLLGRRTFEIWENYWPRHEEYWPGINEGLKYVMSATRKSTEWRNTVFIDQLSDILDLKNSSGPDIQVWGSGELVQLLLENRLVDELRLKIHPITLGSGKKLFSTGTVPATFTLMDHVVTPSGVIIANYRFVDNVKTGKVGAD